MLHSFDYYHGIPEEHYGLQTQFTQINHQPGQLSFLSGINTTPQHWTLCINPSIDVQCSHTVWDWHKAVHFEDDAFLSAFLYSRISYKDSEVIVKN